MQVWTEKTSWKNHFPKKAVSRINIAFRFFYVGIEANIWPKNCNYASNFHPSPHRQWKKQQSIIQLTFGSIKRFTFFLFTFSTWSMEKCFSCRFSMNTEKTPLSWLSGKFKYFQTPRNFAGSFLVFLMNKLDRMRCKCKAAGSINYRQLGEFLQTCD